MAEGGQGFGEHGFCGRGVEQGVEVGEVCAVIVLKAAPG